MNVKRKSGLFFLECEDDYFGQNCKDMCNTTCTSCNKTTGVCDNGCHPGWRGSFCEEGLLCYFPFIKVIIFFESIFSCVIDQTYVDK